LFLILPLVAEVFVIVGLVGWLSVRNGQRAVNQVARQLREETTARISYEISDLLTNTQTINQLTAQTIQRENLDLSNIRSVEDLYWDYINSFSDIKGLGVGNASGDILALFKRTENNEISYFLEYSNAETRGRYLSIQLDSQRQRVQSEAFDRRIDARQRPWYVAAVEAEGPVWTEVYSSVSEVEGHSLAINASYPIYSRDRQLQGVVSVILDLGQVSQLLNSITFSPSGQIYIFEADGELIGSSDGRNPVAVNGEGAKRLKAIDSENLLIRASATYLDTYLESDFDKVNQPLQLDFFLEDDRQFLQITPISVNNQLNWYIVVVAPESDFMAEINAQLRLTIWLCVAAFLIAIGLSILTSRWVAKPLSQFNRAVREVAQGNLDQVVEARRIYELSQLADSFNQMTLQLQTLFAQLSSLNRELSESESRLKQFLEALPIGFAVYNRSGQLTYLNQAGRQLLAIQQEMPASSASFRNYYRYSRYNDERQELYPFEEIPITRALSGETVQTEDVEIRVNDQDISLQVVATPIFDEQGDVTYAIAAFQDITARKLAEEKLVHNALHDSLTGLPNRQFLIQRINMAIARIQRSDRYQFAVLFMDLDRFKIVNDSLGHLAGDELLVQVARSLEMIVRAADLAARIGGDEYVLLLEEVEGIQDAIVVARRILATLEAPMVIQDRSIVITASIGIVMGTAAYRRASDLLRDADIAMYRAKANSKARYEIFNVEMHTAVLNRLQMENDLRRGIADQDFVLLYQPIVSLDAGQLVGFEALVRWRNDNHGLIPPANFIPLAEETGLIVALSDWVLQAVCRQIAVWRDRFPSAAAIKVSINISARDLDETLIQKVAQAINDTGISAEQLTLEITESLLIYHVAKTIDILEALKQLGVTISIDDFGTGYSSLNYLYRLPIDNLKIDKSFIQYMENNDRNRRIVETIITLSNQLNLAAIAEGIETPAQLQCLRELGCELGQGYLFARPMRVKAVSDLFASGQIIFDKP